MESPSLLLINKAGELIAESFNSSFTPGLVVPMPTLPELVMVILSVAELPAVFVINWILVGGTWPLVNEPFVRKIIAGVLDSKSTPLCGFPSIENISSLVPTALGLAWVPPDFLPKMEDLAPAEPAFEKVISAEESLANCKREAGLEVLVGPMPTLPALVILITSLLVFTGTSSAVFRLRKTKSFTPLSPVLTMPNHDFPPGATLLDSNNIPV